MTKFSLSPVRLMLLAVLGSVIILGGAIAAVMALWQPRSLEAMLPENDVIALFSNVTREDLRQWGDRFPELRSVPVFEGRLELGIVKLPKATTGWILSSPLKDVALPDVNGTFRGQKVLLSDSGMMGMMTGNAPRLRAYDPYAHLTRGMTHGRARIYLQTSRADATSMLPAPLRSMISASGAVLLTREGNSARLRVYGKPAEIRASVSNIATLSPAPDLTLALAAPQEMMNLFLSTLPTSERLIKQGQLLKKINDLLEGELSMQYDILPFFQEAATLSWKTGTGSTPSFLFQGRMSDGNAAREKVSALHQNVRQRAGGNTVTTRTFDRGLTSTIIESTPALVQGRTYSIHGWTVRESPVGNNGLLLTALRGRDVVIGNRSEWLDDILAGAAGQMFPALSGYPLAGGALSPSFFTQFTADMRANTGWTWLGANLDTQKSVAWSVETDSQSLTLSVKNE